MISQFQGHLTRHATNYLRSLQCENGSGQYPHVCCVSLNNHEPRQSNSQPTWLPKVNHRNQIRENTGNIMPGNCGLTSLTHRIYGGNETQLDDYPWMALLEYQKRKYFPIKMKKFQFRTIE